MDEKYVIFYDNNVIRPMSLIDKFGNSILMELSKEDAIKYVNNQNEECGEELYWFAKLTDWQNWLQSPHMSNLTEKIYKFKNSVRERLMSSCIIREAIEMDIKDKEKNINGFQISPGAYDAYNNADYEIKLKKKLEDFIKEIDRPAFRREGSLVDDVNFICKKVIMAFKAVKTGKNEEAEKLVLDILKEYKKYPFAVSELDKSYAFRGMAPFNELRSSLLNNNEYENMLTGDLSFFRARVVESEKELHETNEINYLPYSKRFWAQNMRFSLKGKVCLYLGTTSYVCSEECRWNKKDNLYLTSVKFNEKGKKLNILNLAVSQALMNGFIPLDENELYQRELHNAMIRVFPLVIATMFKNETSDEERQNLYGETIKYEYLLSQILMNVLNKEGIDGIAYLSRQGKNEFLYPQMVCLAIPVKNIGSENEYGDLIDCYTITKPVLFNDLNSSTYFDRKSYINRTYPAYVDYGWGKKENYNAKVYYEGKSVLYQETPFSKMDDYMVNQEHKKFSQ